MVTLTNEQRDKFWTDGVLIVENAVTPEELAGLPAVFAEWVAESREHKEDYGEILDGRLRFDLQPAYTADVPRLRPIQTPEEISDVYAEVMQLPEVPKGASFFA
ncbi:MAG: hypothetical protein WBC71_00205 [Salaquimonas sp.]